MTRLITVAETLPFLRQAASLWGEAEHDAFVNYIAANPEAGDVIPDSGGIRKVRWSRPGTGKRGGVRVIYFYHDMEMPLLLLKAYAKNEQEDLSQVQLKKMQQFTKHMVEAHRRRRQML